VDYVLPEKKTKEEYMVVGDLWKAVWHIGSHSNALLMDRRCPVRQEGNPDSPTSTSSRRQSSAEEMYANQRHIGECGIICRVERRRRMKMCGDWLSYDQWL
jgi:hypothetical protein